MNDSNAPNTLRAKSILCFLPGAASFALGIVNYFFTAAVTVLSVIGFLLGTAAIFFSIMVRKAQPDKPPLLASLGLIGGIVGLLWNLVFFVACSSLACGGINMF